MYGTTLLVPGGTYFVTIYTIFTPVTTFVRCSLVCGATNLVNNVSGPYVSQATWCATSVTAVNGGQANYCGSAILNSNTGYPAQTEIINATFYQATTARPYIGWSVAVDSGTATTVAGVYSIGYMRIA